MSDDGEGATMTNSSHVSAQRTAIATSFEPPQDEGAASEEPTEEDQLVAQENDPARFGIHVQPSTTARQLLTPHGNDGVFANMSAKPEVGEIKEEHPPVSLYTLWQMILYSSDRHMMKRPLIMRRLIGIKRCIFPVVRTTSMSMAWL